MLDLTTTNEGAEATLDELLLERYLRRREAGMIIIRAHNCKVPIKDAGDKLISRAINAALHKGEEEADLEN